MVAFFVWHLNVIFFSYNSHNCFHQCPCRTATDESEAMNDAYLANAETYIKEVRHSPSPPLALQTVNAHW